VKGVDEINELLRPLARVEPGGPRSQASGAGARALLATITTQEPGTIHEPGTTPEPGTTRLGRLSRHGSRGPRRLALGLTAAAVVVAGGVMGPGLLGGPAMSYANAAVEIRREGEQYVARIKDPFAEYGRYTEAFHAVGLHVDLRPVPVSPGAVGKILGMMITSKERPGPPATVDPSGPRFGGVALTMRTVPEGCRPGHDSHCYMEMRIPGGFTGEVFVRLGRQARQGEEYANFDSAMAPGEMFDSVRLRDGRAVGDILAEARRRHLTTVFSLIRTDAKTGGLSFEPLPAGQVGRGWIVWNAWQVKAGVIRLLVTRERLPVNPFYNGSAPPPAS
jgi:hypothetical protein